MKKLLAILLSALLLCTMVPFATVAAADEPTVQLSIVDELTEVNAGDEFQVEVNFLNLEGTAGLIGALVEIGFDPAVFELVTTFDEDEELWFPPIEVGPKYNASSNKYIMFSPIDEETGAMNRCLVKYMRATANANQVRREELFFTVTFKVKDDAPSGTYDLTAIQKDGLWHGTVEFEFPAIDTSITVNGSEPDVPAVLYGDVNADGSVNNRDLGLLQRHLNGWDVTIDAAAADVNADGSVNNRDLGLLQRYLNGWGVTLG